MALLFSGGGIEASSGRALHSWCCSNVLWWFYGGIKKWFCQARDQNLQLAAMCLGPGAWVCVADCGMPRLSRSAARAWCCTQAVQPGPGAALVTVA